MPEYGYAGKILKINLSDGKTAEADTSDYADKYIGGHGLPIGEKLRELQLDDIAADMEGRGLLR